MTLKPGGPGGSAKDATQAAAAETLRAIWSHAAEEAKRTATNTNLFRALERAVPVAYEDNTFVVGFLPQDGQMAGVLNTTDHNVHVERHLRAATGNDALRFRVIEGATRDDWDYAKRRDAAALAVRQQSMTKRATQSAAFNTWDDVYDRVSRLYASAEHRNIASGQGRYLDAALAAVSEAMDALYPAEGKADDPTERGLSRVLERIASNIKAEPALVGYLLVQRRRGG